MYGLNFWVRCASGNVLCLPLCVLRSPPEERILDSVFGICYGVSGVGDRVFGIWEGIFEIWDGVSYTWDSVFGIWNYVSVI